MSFSLKSPLSSQVSLFYGKVACGDGLVGFIFGKRKSGYFLIKRLDGTVICASINSDPSRAKVDFLIIGRKEIQKEWAFHPRLKGGFLPNSLVISR